MRLLIYTQMVDKDDPILGFFHGWIIEFSKHFDLVTVVCLKEGVHSLPENVRVHSLGKESGESRIKYILRFYKILHSLQGSYDAVFVHMNPHYVILGGLYWKLKKIPVFFWRNHARMNFMTEIAARFAKEVFYTSRFACTTKYPHAFQMPVGIDTALFVPPLVRKTIPGKIRILLLGRLSPVKRVEVVIEAVNMLGAPYELHIYGEDTSPGKSYQQTLETLKNERIIFHGSVKNYETPRVYGEYDLYVNCTPKGSMDKTVLEATACGIPVIAANASFSDSLPDDSILEMPTANELSKAIENILSLSEEERHMRGINAREKVIQIHSLTRLAEVLSQHIQKYG